MSHYRNTAEANIFTPRSSWEDCSLWLNKLNIKIFPLAVFAFRVVAASIWTTTKWVMWYWRFNPDGNHFSFRLCTPLDYRLHQVVYSAELLLVWMVHHWIQTPQLSWAPPQLLWLKIHESNIYYDSRSMSPVLLWPPIIMSPTIIITHDLWLPSYDFT